MTEEFVSLGIFQYCENCPDRCPNNRIIALKERKMMPVAGSKEVQEADAFCKDKCKNPKIFIIERECPWCGSKDILGLSYEAWYKYKCVECGEILNSHSEL
jgi:hypothetical protein